MILEDLRFFFRYNFKDLKSNEFKKCITNTGFRQWSHGKMRYFVTDNRSRTTQADKSLH